MKSPTGIVQILYRDDRQDVFESAQYELDGVVLSIYFDGSVGHSKDWDRMLFTPEHGSAPTRPFINRLQPTVN